MCGKSNMETYITICKIDSQWEFAVLERETGRPGVLRFMGLQRVGHD